MIRRSARLLAAAAAFAWGGNVAAQATIEDALQAPAPAPYAVQPAPPPAAIPPLRQGQAERLLAALDVAPAHGLPAYATDEVRALLEAGDPRGQTALIDLTLQYAQAQRGGRVNPTTVSELWAVVPAAYDARSELARAIASNQVDAWLASLPPPYVGYRNMVVARERYRQIVEAGGWRPIAGGTALRPGMRDARVPALRERLIREGYSVAAAGAAYDPALVEAVKRYQGRRGLGADGVVAGETLAELNVSPERRLAQIEVNLERWRWLPRSLPTHRIEVNLPTAMLDYYRDGHPHETMRVVVGGKKHQTPIMTAEITAVTFNPPWNVPLSIVKNEIAPKMARDPGYLAREQLKKVGEYAGGLPMLQQAAGPKSALGRVKFESPNEFAVFLHDTPSRGGFSRADRLLSHGCVRLQRPLELAEMVLEDHPDWTPERMQDAIDAGSTVRVGLVQPIPMFLLYWTAFVDEKGGVHFRDDIYEWDTRLTAALDQTDAAYAAAE